jgi:S1-C subfamily serine protease
LVDVAGRVIGINTTGLTRGSAVTILAASVSRVVDELLERGHVRRGFLGVGFHPIETGLIILSLEKDGPAARAGVLVGDVLVALDGKPVSDTDDVQAHLGSGSVGRAVRAEFVRGGQRVTLEITPEERQSRK